MTWMKLGAAVVDVRRVSHGVEVAITAKGGASGGCTFTMTDEQARRMGSAMIEMSGRPRPRRR